MARLNKLGKFNLKKAGKFIFKLFFTSLGLGAIFLLWQAFMLAIVIISCLLGFLFVAFGFYMWFIYKPAKVKLIKVENIL